MAKLIFCFDGTSNEPSDFQDFFDDNSISNILKIYALVGGSLDKKETDLYKNGQKSFYYSGIGTQGSWLKRKFNSLFAPTYGDMADIIESAKKDLIENYQDGDEIFIFGFSRGAAIARIFAAKHIENKSVSFMGLFDTVAAIKGSRDLDETTYPASGILFEDAHLADHIQKAVHLVAIDEKRVSFQPTLFNKNKKVTEIWFSGAHSDIGGGFWFDGLSDITLNFMCEKIKEAGLILLKPEDIEFDIFNKDDDGNKLCLDDIDILPLVDGKLHEQLRSGIASKTLAPRFIRVNVDDKPSKEDIPIIHYTVIQRFEKVISYRPYALRNCRFKIIFDDGSISKDSFVGISGLRTLVDSLVEI